MARVDAHFWRGVVCTLFGAALWGFSGTCAQFLLANYDIAPTFVTMIRMTGAGLLFLAFLLARRRERLFAMLRDHLTVGRLFLFGAGGLYLCQITYIVVIGYTNAGTATVLQCTGIVFIMLFTCLIARKLPRLREFAGLVAAMVATWLIATHGDPSTLALPLGGLVWGVINGLTVAVYVMYPKRLFAEWGSLAVTGMGMLTGGLAAAVVWACGIVDGRPAVFPALDAAGWLTLGVITVVGTCAAFGLYLHGVSIVGSVKGGLLGAIEPVSATLCSALWLGTSFAAADWAGLILMLSMVFLVTAKKPSAACEESGGVENRGEQALHR